MPKEIERKYLVAIEARSLFRPTRTRIIESAYLSAANPEVRVARYRGESGSYQLTVKAGQGISRDEVVLDIEDAPGEELFAMAPHQVRKIRDDAPVAQHTSWDANGIWEIDTYLDRYAGLVVAEIELTNASSPVPRFPTGIIKLAEVTQDERFKNRNLAMASDEDAQKILAYYNTLAAPKSLV